MKRADVVVIGAGQAGLAMSACLGRFGVEHVLLDRGRVAERWRSERWDSLRLLTPNWMTRLPGRSYGGPDTDGYMTADEVVAFLDGYARALAAPVETGVVVRRVTRDDADYSIETSRGLWNARMVVVATGHCEKPLIPEMAQALPGEIRQLTPSSYRNPSSLPDGGVLVVGASASGVQIAEELRAAGREVAIAVGRHIRLPRLYRGRDVMWWMDRAGVLDEAAHEVPDLRRARAQPSLQLVGRPDRRSVDLAALRDQGVRVFGRAAAVEGTVLRFRDDLAETTAAAQRRLDRLLRRFDAVAGAIGAPGDPEPAPPIRLPTPPATLDLKAEGISTIIWATGFHRDYRWLEVPVLDAAGEIEHCGGVTASPGLYVLGLRFLRRRKSNFIDGVGADAEALAALIAARLGASAHAA